MDNRLKIALRFVLLILIGSLIGFSPSANSVTENTQKVRLAFAAEDYSTGAAILIDLAEKNPWWITLWESAGDAAYLGGDYPTAKSAYEKALQNNDLSIEGQIKLGQTYLQVGEQLMAVETWQELEDMHSTLLVRKVHPAGGSRRTRNARPGMAFFRYPLRQHWKMPSLSLMRLVRKCK